MVTKYRGVLWVNLSRESRRTEDGRWFYIHQVFQQSSESQIRIRDGYIPHTVHRCTTSRYNINLVVVETWRDPEAEDHDTLSIRTPQLAET
ncbi:Protein of unknown function [Pyronema omphalodes CBS 100304]|uniref:Uncharacterized protein n=1 Tax=Pyronema omphalodes (strain CBS 100304) TaxID=1076935 RepID=U4LK18_PYROM|nr:Protein of unknown function [Pyronema omphalodes CBS 100304]